MGYKPYKSSIALIGIVAVLAAGLSIVIGLFSQGSEIPNYVYYILSTTLFVIGAGCLYIFWKDIKCVKCNTQLIEIRLDFPSDKAASLGMNIQKQQIPLLDAIKPFNPTKDDYSDFVLLNFRFCPKCGFNSKIDLVSYSETKSKLFLRKKIDQDKVGKILKELNDARVSIKQKEE